MATALELTWVEVGSKWTPGRAFPLKLRLKNTGDVPMETIKLEGPNPFLGFSVVMKGGEPQWHAGAEASALAGLTGNQGLLVRDTLAPGASWETEEELAQYWLPPLPGRYVLQARYAGEGGVVLAEEREIEVVPAGLLAVDAAFELASENLLVHAWGDSSELWLRIAPGAPALTPRYLHAAGNWPGKGTVRVAQQSFSPVVDPPIPAYRFWATWLGGGKFGGSLVDYLGVTLSSFAQEVEEGRLLTPVQQEDAELLVPVATKRGVLVWYRVGPEGGGAAPWAEWPFPAGLAPMVVAAHPSGTVAVIWGDPPGRHIAATFGTLEKKLPAEAEQAQFDAGQIVHVDVLDLHRGLDLLLLRLVEDDSTLVLNVHRRGKEAQDIGPLPLPTGIVPAGGFRGAWVPRFGPVVVMRDDAGRLWAAPGIPRAEWKRVGDLRASRGFGIAASANGVVVWAADEEMGLRFAPVSIF